jgi:hypothetical protein
MEIIGVEPGEAGVEEEARPPVHYSTGRLTRAQAGVVDRWRERLREDRPLPGRQPVGEALRLVGIDDRPRASCSDMIAVAVTALLGAGRPDDLEVARFADTCWQAQRGRSSGAEAGVYQPVSFYLDVLAADRYEELRASAAARVRDEQRQAMDDAFERFPADRHDQSQRNQWAREELRSRRVPLRSAKIPAGVLARMAIDRWSGRTADEVASAAAEYALMAHEHPHRGRRDMRKLLGEEPAPTRARAPGTGQSTGRRRGGR